MEQVKGKEAQSTKDFPGYKHKLVTEGLHSWMADCRSCAWTG